MNTTTCISETALVQPAIVRRVLIVCAGVVGFALATAAASQVRFFVPGTPVPVTAQTAVVLLAGLTLGSRLGAASMLFYLLLGLTGYHVFALQGATLSDWGLAYIVGPTGGYLIGFVLAQPLLGRLTRGPSPWRRGRRILAAIALADAAIFGCGLLWLGLWSQATVAQTLAMGLVPFLPGLAAKSALALVLAAPSLRRLRPMFDAGG